MGGDPRPADEARENRRHRQRPAALQPADARGRRIRHDRRDQRRPADRGPRRRRRAGVLQLHDQPDATPASMFREAMDLVLRAWTEPGPFEHYGEALEAQVRQPLAAADPTAASADLDSRRRQQGDDRVRRRSAASATWAFRISTSTSSSATSTCSASGRKRAATKPAPSSSAGSAPSTSPKPTSRPGPSTKSTSSTSQESAQGLVVFPPGYTSVRSIAAIHTRPPKFLITVENRTANRRRRLRHRRQPRDGARQADRIRQTPRRRQPARPLPARHASRPISRERT